MRKEFYAANWKEYKTDAEAAAYFGHFKGLNFDSDVVICPSFVSLATAHGILADSGVSVGCQDLSVYEHGAYTGEVSAFMVKAFCKYAILGHSERREHFHENDHIINLKLKNALMHSLKPILCIGENSAQHKNNRTFSVLWSQLKGCLKDISGEQINGITIAYEPIWAISKGDSSHKPAEPAGIQDTHAFIRQRLAKLYGSDVAQDTRIIYGGSVRPENISAFMEMADIDGALVGGASLDPVSFEKIVSH